MKKEIELLLPTSFCGTLTLKQRVALREKLVGVLDVVFPYLEAGEREGESGGGAYQVGLE